MSVDTLIPWKFDTDTVWRFETMISKPFDPAALLAWRWKLKIMSLHSTELFEWISLHCKAIRVVAHSHSTAPLEKSLASTAINTVSDRFDDRDMVTPTSTVNFTCDTGDTHAWHMVTLDNTDTSTVLSEATPKSRQVFWVYNNLFSFWENISFFWKIKTFRFFEK